MMLSDIKLLAKKWRSLSIDELSKEILKTRRQFIIDIMKQCITISDEEKTYITKARLESIMDRMLETNTINQ